MEKQNFTVEEVAEMLDIHHRTVRRYIKEGKLEARKIGGQWRISRENLELIMGDKSFVKEAESVWNSQLEDFIFADSSRIAGKIQVCSIIDCFAGSSVEIAPLASKLINMMNAEDDDRETAKFHYVWNDEKKKARFILWGNPSFLQKLIGAIAEFDKEQECLNSH